MTRHAPLTSADPTAGERLLLDATRCWRAARDSDRPVQPSLFQALLSRDCCILAPVFDSLLRLYESASGRRLVVGGDSGISDDEQLLLGLVGGWRTHRLSLACAAGVAAALECAVRSTRIMMEWTLPTARLSTP